MVGKLGQMWSLLQKVSNEIRPHRGGGYPGKPSITERDVVKKILVTGGAGFIGSHLVDALLADGLQVVVVDNFSTGKRDNLQQDHPALSIIDGDVRDLSTVEAAARGVNAIVHLAAVASVQASVDDPAGTHQVNLVGTLNLLQAARKHDIRRFVYASSAAIYGDTEQLPVSEDSLLSPLTPYAADKLAGEHYCDFYSRQYGLEPVIFRFFNIFGPRQDPSSPYSGVISIFLQQALKRLPMTVFGDGEQSRDFVYVADLVRLLVAAIMVRKPPVLPMNVGNGDQTSLNQLLQMIGDFAGAPLVIRYADPRPGDIRHSCADNSLIHERLDYQQRHTVAAGLRETYAWMKANQNNRFKE